MRRSAQLPIVHVLSLVLLLGLIALPLTASSHREAPAILTSPAVDGTDFYMFRSYEPGRQGFVTLIANYNPLQDPYGGPNYFPLDPDAYYDIHIDNNGDAVEDLTFRFRFDIRSRFLTLPAGGMNTPVSLINLGMFGPGFDNSLLNQNRFYTVRAIRGPVDSPTSTTFFTRAGSPARTFPMPIDNIGNKSIPDYEGYTQRFIFDTDIPGCEGGRIFSGQRKESFAVNLGEIFDLVNLDPVGPRDSEPSQTEDKNITSLALEVPIECLTGGNQSGIIAGWTTSRLPRVRRLIEDPTFEKPVEQSGSLLQVSRLANPLVNEIVIGLPDKNRFNVSKPSDDAQFLQYVTNPWLPEVLQALFGVEAPNNFPRQDLVATFLTGIPGLNEDGSVGEMMRLNTNIDPTPAAEQSDLGVVGGDAAGFPNGRRPGDDSVDIALRAVMGVLCHIGVGCAPEDAPAGLLPFTDGTIQKASQFDNHFPYLTTPLPGSPN